MAADLPENYAGQPAFQFIKDVPVDWEETQVLHAAIGDYVTIVRQDRQSEEWYLGSITDELSRTLQTPLTFLPPERQFVAEIYADAPGADWETNPLALEIREQLVDRETILQLTLAPGGGQAIRFRPATTEELKRGVSSQYSGVRPPRFTAGYTWNLLDVTGFPSRTGGPKPRGLVGRLT